jgi:hypothetical protein
MPNRSYIPSTESPDTSSVGQSSPGCGEDFNLSETSALDPFSDSNVILGDVEFLRPNVLQSEEQQSPIRPYFQDFLDQHSDHELEQIWRAFAEYISGLVPLRPNKLRCGQAVFGESHLGTIIRLSDSVVVVRYGSGDNQFELEYKRDQFSNGAVVEMGDSIEACIALWREPYKAEGINHYLSEAEQAELDAAWTAKRGVVGDLDL